jgi:hypothetical protein
VSVLNRNCADITIAIQIKNRVLVEIPGFIDLGPAELDVQSVGILKVFDFHGSNDRSKKALCTVSPSGSKITRKYFPSTSGMGPHDECDRLAE